MTQRHALITGASRGIGAAIAVRLAAAGWPVILNYRSNDAAAREVQETIEAAGGAAELCAFDVADPEAADAAIASLLEAGREIDVIVNNAGVVADGPFPAMALDDWRRITRTTLDGFYNVTRPLVMPMVRRKWGRIVNISSVSGVMGNRGQVNYSAAKAGLIGATRSLSKELARRKITVNAVAPGLIDTEIITGMTDIAMQAALAQIPLGRLGKAEEVAGLVTYLASDRADYITGQVFVIDGGLGI